MTNKEKIAAYKKEWALKNREKIKIRLHNWYLANKNTKIKEYKNKNKEKLLRQKRESYRRNKTHYQEYWSRPEIRIRQKKYKYRNRSILKNLIHHKESEWVELLKKHDYKCVDCGTTEKIEKDHIIPLSKGGQDTIDNLAPRCRSCNARKGNRIYIKSFPHFH